KYKSLKSDELVAVCAESRDTEAWEEFVSRFQRIISVVIWRVARRYGEKNVTVVKDLTQDTYLKICSGDRRLLRNFNPHHEDAFEGMLRVTAANIAYDYFRAQYSEKRGSGKAHVELNECEGSIPATHSTSSTNIERRILLQEIDSVLNQ